MHCAAEEATIRTPHSTGLQGSPLPGVSQCKTLWAAKELFQLYAQKTACPLFLGWRAKSGSFKQAHSSRDKKTTVLSLDFSLKGLEAAHRGHAYA